MKVLFIGYDFLLKNNHLLLNKLASKGISISVLIPFKWRIKWRDTVVYPEITKAINYIIRRGGIWFSGFNSITLYYSGLIKSVRERPDIIFVWQEPWSIVCFQAILVKLIFSPESKVIFRTSQNTVKYRCFVFNYLEKFNFRYSHAGVAVTETARETLIKKGFLKEISVIPHAVNTDIFKQKECADLKKELGLRDFTVGYVGGITRQKNIETLIEAVRNIDDVRLMIIGSGPHKPVIEKRIEESGLTERTVMLADMSSDKIPAYMNCMDVLVLPSITVPGNTERFGRVLIEAMACGTAVIGSSSGEIQNVIADAGMIFREGDSSDLKNKIILVKENPELRRKLIEKGIQRVLNNYSWKNLVSRTYLLLEKVLEKRKGIIYIGAVHWGYLFQRYHHIALRLSREYPVVYLESLGLRTPKLQKADIFRMFSRFKRFIEGIKPVKHNLAVLSPLLIPYQKNSFIRSINIKILEFQIKSLCRKTGISEIIFWSSIPTWLVYRLNKKLSPELSVYDCPDDYSTIEGAPADILDSEKKIVKDFDITFAASQNLFERLSKVSPNAKYLPNGCNYEHFQMSEHAVPKDMKMIEKPVICFAGAFYEWVDTELLEEATDALKEYSWVFIGPVRGSCSFAGRKNVHFLGRKEYAILPSYLAESNVGILPFRKGKHMDSANPVIMYEYLAMGIPVVSTVFPEVEKFRDLIYICDGNRNFIAGVKRALSEDTQELKNKRKKIAADYSWRNILADIQTVLK